VTERGLPHADGATACPFVAFDDDRDERSSVPDHRHRCFAELQPAPRALAHQEAYCLSAAFPVCPTFQDWARREAARSRDGGRPSPSPTAARAVDRGSAEPPVVAPGLAAAAAAAEHLATAGSTAQEAGADAPVDSVPPSAPPTGTSHETPDEEDRDGHDEADAPDEYRVARPDDLAQRNPPRDWAAPPPWLASAEGRPSDDAEPPSFLGRRAADPGQGLAGSPADRMAGGSPPPARVREDDEWTSSARTAPPPRTSASSRADRFEDDREGVDEEEDERGRPGRRPRAYSQHLGGPDGPDWERPRRYEAYPTIKTRVGLPRVPGIPPLVAMAAVIGALALILFFLPGILNFGGTGGPAGSAGPSSSAQPSVSLAPTIAPEPTPGLYTIKKGETLSKIAKAHGITLEELLAANPTIKDPNKISEGQQIIIPLPSEEPLGSVGGSTAP
jgi:LysM repeat protein